MDHPTIEDQAEVSNGQPREDLKAAIEADKQKRGEGFVAAIQKAMKDFDYNLVGVPKYVPDGAGGWRLMIEVQPVAN